MDKPSNDNTTGQDDKILAALSYLFILSIVMMLLKRDSSFVQFHAKQGFVLWIASMIVWFIPLLGWLLFLVILVFVILGFIQALNGMQWRMPVVFGLSQKINF